MKKVKDTLVRLSAFRSVPSPRSAAISEAAFRALHTADRETLKLAMIRALSNFANMDTVHARSTLLILRDTLEHPEGDSL